MTWLDWQPVESTRITHEAYDPEGERIYVRFPKSRVEWCYRACPPHVWKSFTAPGQSRGEFIAEVLNYKPNGRHTD
jgi:KTSC domain